MTTTTDKVTFFTTTEKINDPFLNSLESWLKLSCVDKIFVYTSKPQSTFDVYSSFNKVIVKPYTDCDGLNHPPYVKSLFNQSTEDANTDYLCYVNSDIMFLNDFESILDKCNKVAPDGIYQFIGRRTDWFNWQRLSMLSMSDDEIREFVKNGDSSLRSPGHADYFCFHRKVYEELQEKRGGIPDFYIARTVFDHWLSYAPRFVNRPNINVTNELLAIHHEEPRDSRMKDWATKPKFWEQVEHNKRMWRQNIPPPPNSMENSANDSAEIFL